MIHVPGGSVAAFVMACSASILPAAAESQLPRGVALDPSAAVFDYSALDAFSQAYRRLPSQPDTGSFLAEAYFERSGPGLAAFSRIYGFRADQLARSILERPARYAATALEAPPSVRRLEPDIRAAYERLKILYPEAVFPTVYYLVGPTHAGGAVQREGILIAVETHVRDGRRSLAELPSLVAHELAHYQQAAFNPARYQESRTLLARAIREGVADYVAELLTGRHTNPDAHAFGAEREWELWSRFRCEKELTDPLDWLFDAPPRPDWPQALGYFVGYRIAAHRYAVEVDPSPAVTALLQVPDYEELLLASGYEAYLERLHRRAFPACPVVGNPDGAGGN